MQPGAPAKKRWRVPLVVVVLLLAMGGVAAYILTANRAPVAAFDYTVDGLDVSFDAGDSSDPDGRIATYAWDFGDGATGTGLTTTHSYAAPGGKTVTLTVTDDRGATGSGTQTVEISNLPVARFTATRDLMHADVDGSASLAFDGTITAYSWNWGDGTPAGVGVTASHDYTTPGRYDITLTVTDSSGGGDTATRTVSVSTTTVDYRMYDFFQIPYAEWWSSLRGPVYGDIVLRNQAPYTNLYPWAEDLNDTFVYTNFREDVVGRNVLGYSVENPVFFPVLNASVPSPIGATMDVDWYLQYIDTPRKSQLTSDGWFISNGWMDGFLSEWTAYLTMDYDTSQRIFNVSGDPAAWWAANTVAGASQGWLDNLYGAWYESYGKDIYDVWSAFEWYYTLFYVDVSAQVLPGPGGTNTTVAKVYMITWGQEVLLARWFYWGTGAYPDGTPSGWRREEVGWFEDFTFNATIGESMDFTMSAIMGYQFTALGTVGPDGQWDTADDEAIWAWIPQLMDYLYSTPGHPKAELDAWTGLQVVNARPGTPHYGQPYRVDVAYVAWDLKAGETITLEFPTTDVAWYRPYTSYWDPGLSTPVFDVFLAPARFRGFVPATVGTWNDATMTGEILGPLTVGGGSPPLEGLPRFEFAPRT